MWLQFPWPEHESTQEGQPGVAMAAGGREERKAITIALFWATAGGGRGRRGTDFFSKK